MSPNCFLSLTKDDCQQNKLLGYKEMPLFEAQREDYSDAAYDVVCYNITLVWVPALDFEARCHLLCAQLGLCIMSI